MIIQWKQRLYAFLLRRVLGPWLDDESLAQLHQSIDVALHEGRFALINVGLNTAHLTEQAFLQQHQWCSIRQARLQRLEIILTLEEHAAPPARKSRSNNYNNNNDDDDDDTEEPSTMSSLAWRAMQLGTSTVALVAHIVIDGVLLEIVPGEEGFVSETQNSHDSNSQHRTTTSHSSPSHKRTFSPDTTTSTTNTTTDVEAAAVKTSMLSSYIDAALASLRLSFDLKSLCIRACSPASIPAAPHNDNSNHQQNTSALAVERFVELQIKSISYHDVDVVQKDKATKHPVCTYETVMHKALDVHTLTVLVGEASIPATEPLSNTTRTTTTTTTSSGAAPIALLEGPSQIRLRAVSYQTMEDSTVPPRIQQDVEVNLNQRLNLSVDAFTLNQILSMVQSFQQGRPSSSRRRCRQYRGDNHVQTGLSVYNGHTGDTVAEDQADLQTIDGIMKQYQEARKLVEQNHFRGGILLPADDDDEHDENGGGAAAATTFDAFFDANDASFARYSTILKESLLMAPHGATAAAATNFAHTKLRFHLREGGCKLSFFPSLDALEGGAPMTSRRRRADEYILITFTELNVTSDLAFQRAEHTLNILQLDIEDSSRRWSNDNDSGVNPRNVEIGSLVKFAISNDDEGETGLQSSEVLLQAPCVALTVKTSNQGDVPEQDVELVLEPLELCYHPRAIDNLTEFAKSVQVSLLRSEQQHNGNRSQLDQPMPLKRQLYLSCPQITLTLPMIEEKNWDRLYQRCSFVRDLNWNARSSLNICMSHVCLCFSTNVEAEPRWALEMNDMIAYATSSSSGNIFGGKCRQFDIFCLYGRNEVNPRIPVSAKLWISSEEQPDKEKAKVNNHGKRTFPETPTISSFKARQEDEDDDNRIDRVLASKLDGVNVGSRSDLRGNDPQADMMAQASKSMSVLEISIPEAITDVTTEELSELLTMLQNIFPTRADCKKQDQAVSDESSALISISLNCDFASVALHNAFETVDGSESNSGDQEHATFLLHLSECRAHAVKCGRGVNQFRVLAHEADVFEGKACCNLLGPSDVS